MIEIKDFTFPSSTGRNIIHARIAEPEGEPRGIVQIAHGITEHIGRYESFMRFLAENGFIAVGNDHLGHGRSFTDPSDLGFFAERNGWDRVVDDVDILHDIVSRDHRGLPYIFFGHSMGSFIVRTYAILHPSKPDLIILCGTGHLSAARANAGCAAAAAAVKMFGVRRAGDMLNNIAFGSYNDGFENVRTNFDWLNSDPDEINRYIADPLCGFIPKIGLFRDMMNGIRFITDPANIKKMNKDTPVLLLSGWEDPVGERGKGVRRAYKAFVDAGIKHVRIKLYPKARHELLNERCRDEVKSDILGFRNEKLALSAEAADKED